MDNKYSIEFISDIREQVKKELKPARYEHTLGVAYTAACMAFLFGEDPLKAELAGILHDCAKCYPHEEQIRICREAGIPLSSEELASPAVIHAICGKHLAAARYGIEDQDLLNAIGSHTTGRPAMSRLENIIYFADFIEPLRSEAPNLSEVRKLAFQDLDECMYRILMSTIDYLNGRGVPVVPATMDAFLWFRAEREGTGKF